jgi:hypothetical protein
VSDVHDQIERVREESGIPADDTAEETLTADPPPDRTRQFTHQGFSRMRTGWIGDDHEKVQELEALADQMVKNRFQVAFAVIERIHRSVRTQAASEETGELLAYPDGTPMWKKDELGAPEEDWGMLSDRDRRGLLFTIATHMFEWELAGASAWAEAMYSKAIWEQAFASGFTALPPGVVSGKPTIDDRTQWGHKNAAEDRYFALFESSLSRKGDGILRAMRGLQRILENTAIW